MRLNRIAPGALTFLVIGATGSAGWAQTTECGALPANALVASGSTAVNPLFVALAAGGLAATAGIDIYHAGGGSCGGSDKFLSQADLGGLTATHWGADGMGATCTLPAGTKADFGVSDVFYESCPPTSKPLPTGFKDWQGPVQPMLFVVPKNSSQQGLVAEEGYFVFGFGGAAGKTVAPWTDLASLIIRDETSGTQQMLARAVGLPNGNNGIMKGTTAMPNSSGGVVATLKMKNTDQATAEPTIGLLGADVYDQGTNRTDLKALFFQGFKQKHGYLPDSTATSHDRRNVRDGRYVIWGPSHWFTAVGTDGKAVKAKVQELFDYLTLAKPTLGTTNVADFILKGSYIPMCAMKVKRSADLGPVSAVASDPVNACGCYMDEKVGATTPGCKKCKGDPDCTAPKKCSRYGYCE